MQPDVRIFLKKLARNNSIFIEATLLKKSYGAKWQRQAESKISASEIVIVYDTEECEKSENTKWEIEKAKSLKIPIVELSKDEIVSYDIGKLQSYYDFNEEFDNCFNYDESSKELAVDLYKIMVSSSDDLVSRRQITNGFFLTVIASIIGAIGLSIKEEFINAQNSIFLLFPILIGILMCRSWGNLIDNYGKLNTGKFKVINKIENDFPIKIFEAEWIALGRGVRPNKYKSFTQTEKNVPYIFMIFLILLFVIVIFLSDWSFLNNFFNSLRAVLPHWC